MYIALNYVAIAASIHLILAKQYHKLDGILLKETNSSLNIYANDVAENGIHFKY
jgi:hypothetical protein